MAIDDAAIAGIRGAGSAETIELKLDQAKEWLSKIATLQKALEDSKNTASGMGTWGQVPQFQSSYDIKAAFTETQLNDIRTSLDKGIEYCKAFETTVRGVFAALHGASQTLD